MDAVGELTLRPGLPLLAHRSPITPRLQGRPEPVELTSSEFDLLYALARQRGRVVSREQLIEQVWGYNYYGEDRLWWMYTLDASASKWKTTRLTPPSS